jgi:hypothetical protein
MKTLTIILSLFFLSSNAFSKTVKKTRKRKSRTTKSISFFAEQAKKEDNKFAFNQYEHLISGVAAFAIGNIGYLATDSSVLKLAYSGIQTIGIINVGRGVYQRNSPSLKKSFSKILSNKKVKGYSKPRLSKELLKIFAQEERAKRLSLFYSTSFLTLQYLMNATIYDSPDRVKNIYIFLGGINAIVAAYSSLYKSDYEKFYYGDDIDLNPFVLALPGETQMGLSLAIRF